ncbi:uncharacterized protein [Dermacentor albipictus]|uniref:uncharacterized protein n=1 Tax=Dermacentor albipictus TaxID=60249 RepID=UPI0038FCA9EC
MSAPPRSLGEKNRSGHNLNSDSRNMILHCYMYWRNREPERSVEGTSKFVAEMLGVSENTVFRKKTNDFSKRMDLLSLKRCSVRGLLAEIDFKHEKKSRNSGLSIAERRNRYLRDVERQRAEGRKIFLDETWVAAGYTRSIVWTDTVVRKWGRLFTPANGLSAGLKQPSGKGQHLIGTHFGSEDGFVDGCLDVFRGQKTGDYHEDMDGNRFEGLFNAVLQKLPAGSAFVMDNAPYHTRREEKLPTTAVEKERCRTESAACFVLRIPPYHCKFNPIELVWAEVKNGIALNSRDFKLSVVEYILREKINNITLEECRKNIQHVMDLEARLRLDTYRSDHIQLIIIQLGEDGTEESDSDCELSGIEPLNEA